MENTHHNLVIVKSDRIHTGIVKYAVLASRFLSADEKNEISQLKESEFLKLASENHWTAQKR